ncbi:MAG: chemotaxis protein MotB [Bradymonadia bacterium]|jgi:chemotaxis protein MotB
MAKPKKKKAASRPEGDPSVVLFTALGLILVAFFIMLNNLASPDSARSRAAIDSLVGTFGVMPGFRVDGAGAQPPPPSENNEERAALLSDLRSMLESSQIDGAHVEHDAEGRVVVRFEQELLFDSGGSRISPRYFRTLDSIGALIVRMNYPVQVEGHTDSSPGSDSQSNWYYSSARAAAVHRYLEGTAQVPSGLVSTIGFADSRPRADLGDSFDHNQRRVEVVFFPVQRRN